MKLIIFSLVYFFGAGVYATENNSRIKSCLASMYSFQKVYHNEHKKFSDSLAEFSTKKYPDCESFKIDSISANKSSFTITLKVADKVWTIDSLKKIQQLK